MQLAERVFKDVLALDVNCQVFSPDARISSRALWLRSEVSPLHVEIQDAGVIYKHREGAISQVCRRLAQNLKKATSLIKEQVQAFFFKLT